MQQFIADWGYIAVLLGSIFEGESIVLAGGFAAHRRLLSLPWVVLVAAIGSAIGDQIWFQLGRHYGPKVVARFPSLAPGIARATRLLARYDTGFIIASRFIYGTRLAGPIAIGHAGVNPVRFTLINIAASIAWALLVAGLGYGFGETMFQIFGHIHDLERRVVPGLLSLGVAAALTVLWLRRR